VGTFVNAAAQKLRHLYSALPFLMFRGRELSLK
jgi:hypothetical protein